MIFSKKLILANLIFIIGFILILLEVFYNGSIVNLDLKINSLILLFENNFTYGLSNIFSIIFDTIGIAIITLVLCAYLWFKYPRKKEAIFFAVSMILTALITFIIKETVGRARPMNALVIENSFSFPSGHVTTSVAFFGLVCYLIFRKSRTYSIKLITILMSSIVAILISLSRLFLNVHWFSDVIGGFLLGLFILTGCILFYAYLEKKD